MRPLEGKKVNTSRPLAGKYIVKRPTQAQKDWWALVQRSGDQAELARMPKNNKGQEYKSLARAKYYAKISGKKQGPRPSTL